MSAVKTAVERANPGALPQPIFNVCLAAVVIGVVSFVGGVSSDPQSAWLAFHSNFIFFTLLSCGGLVLTAIYSIVGAHWPGPYRRFAESLAAFLPIAAVLGVVGMFGGEHLFDWQANGAVHGKEPWLNTTRSGDRASRDRPAASTRPRASATDRWAAGRRRADTRSSRRRSTETRSRGCRGRSEATRSRRRWTKRPKACRCRRSSSSSSMSRPSRSGTTSSAAWLGVAARTSATRSAMLTSTSCPTADTTGVALAAMARATASLLKAARSSALPPPRPTMSTSLPPWALRRSMADTISAGACCPCTRQGDR